MRWTTFQVADNYFELDQMNITSIQNKLNRNICMKMDFSGSGIEKMDYKRDHESW